MPAALVMTEDVLRGTKPGTRPGTLLVLCQCCRGEYRKIMAEVSGGKLVIETKAKDDAHFVVLGADLCDRMAEDRHIWCACCDRSVETGRVLADCSEGVLLIRAIQHGRLHFVLLGPSRLQGLLAFGGEGA